MRGLESGVGMGWNEAWELWKKYRKFGGLSDLVYFLSGASCATEHHILYYTRQMCLIVKNRYDDYLNADIRTRDSYYQFLVLQHPLICALFFRSTVTVNV